MSDLARIIDLVDIALGKASETVAPERLAEPAAIVDAARRRVGYLGDSVVIALAGGTGSGKSSLLNAIAGETVAEVAAIRPTTSVPFAWMPQTPEPGIVRLLDDMGIERRAGHNQPHPFVLIDMPDTDSVVGAHRDAFERLLPRVDVVWWVVDPEKYADRLLHQEYLRPLADYQDQFVFVFNQIDRLRPSELDSVLADFRRLLAFDGIHDPSIVAAAANPTDGSPQGISDLVSSAAALRDAKRAVTAKTLVDIRRAVGVIREETGVDDSGIEFEDRWALAKSTVVDRLVDMVVSSDVSQKAAKDGAALALQVGSGPVGRMVTSWRGTLMARALGMSSSGVSIKESAEDWIRRPGRDHALGTLEGLVSDVAFSTGGSFANRIRSDFDQHRIEGVVDKTVDVALHRRDQGEPETRRWWVLAGLIKWLLALLVVGGGVWWYASPPERGTVPWHLVMVFGGVILGFVLSRMLDISGRKVGHRLVADFSKEVRADIEAQLERGIGTPLRSALRSRAEVAALLTEISLETQTAARSIIA